MTEALPSRAGAGRRRIDRLAESLMKSDLGTPDMRRSSGGILNACLYLNMFILFSI